MPSKPSAKTIFSIIVGLLVLAGIAYLAWWYIGGGNNAPQEQKGPQAVQIMYTPDGFSPANVTIKQGTTVTFLDRDGGGLWVASDDHKTHAKYAGTPIAKHCPDSSGLSFDQCTKGIMYSFTFQKTGAWGYHNHEHPEAVGVITVTQ
jgi:plastocyanin